MIFTCLQFDAAVRKNEFADGIMGEITPEQAAFYVAHQYYEPSWRFVIADEMPINRALESCFAAGNYHPNDDLADWRRLRERAHSISVGDVLREDATGRHWICAAIGWTEMPAPALPGEIAGRDPRQDPRPGDRIAPAGEPRAICLVMGALSDVHYMAGDQVTRVDLAAWRKLAKDALVLTVDPEHNPFAGETNHGA